MGVLTAAVSIIAVLAAFNLLLTFGLIRRLRLMGSTGVGKPALPALGALVGSFATSTLDGATVSERDLLSGPAVVGFFEAECQPCADLKREILDRGAPASLLAFVEGSAQDQATLAFARDLATFARVAVVEPSSSPARAFGVTAFPTLMRLHDGVVVAAGHRLGDVETKRAPQVLSQIT